MPVFRSASDQANYEPIDADRRRLSEWPVGPTPDQFAIGAIDQLSITLKRIAGPAVPTPRSLPRPLDVPPRRRWNVLACGGAAPVITLMLLKGARRVLARQPGFEPLLLVCELDTDPALLSVPSFPLLVTRQQVVDILADPDTTIDALVWYDIGGDRTLPYLWMLRDARDTVCPECSIVVLAPLPNAAQAASEFTDVRLERTGMMAATDQLYREVADAVEGHRDSDPYGCL